MLARMRRACRRGCGLSSRSAVSWLGVTGYRRGVLDASASRACSRARIYPGVYAPRRRWSHYFHNLCSFPPPPPPPMAILFSRFPPDDVRSSTFDQCICPGDHGA